MVYYTRGRPAFVAIPSFRFPYAIVYAAMQKKKRASIFPPHDAAQVMFILAMTMLATLRQQRQLESVKSKKTAMRDVTVSRVLFI